MGFAVLAKIFHYRALIADIVRWVGRHQPRAVCFVDSSGLNLRIARGLFEQGYSVKGGGKTRALYYISPQIWASRAGRRFGMARQLDGLAAIFPFEQAVYADTSLPVEFVGHPFVAPEYSAPVSHDPDGPVLLLPGSRRQVVTRLFPVMLKAYRLSGTDRPAVVLYPGEEIRAELLAHNPPANVRLLSIAEGGPGGPDLPQSSVAASAVLTASGTMSMHCALAGIPGALTYKTDYLTYILGRLLVKVEFIGIANLLLKEPMYPEFIQGAAKPVRLAEELRLCLTDAARREQTRVHATRLRDLLSQTPPSSESGPTGRSVVDWMLDQLSR